MKENVWNDPEFAQNWNETYGLDMSRAPIRTQFIFPLLEKKIGDMEGLHLADLGCGNGNLILHFNKASFASWTGIDGGKAILDTARESVKDPRVKFIHKNLTSTLPIKEASMDIVTSIFVLQEIPLKTHETFFNNISKMLKPEGKAFIFGSHPSYALVQDVLAVETNNSVNTKFPGHKGYFDSEPTEYVLSILNKEKKYDKKAFHHHTPISDTFNMAVKSGLYVHDIKEVPQGVINVETLATRKPKQGDIPRFVHLEMRKIRA